MLVPGARAAGDSATVEINATVLVPLELEAVEDSIDFGIVNTGQEVAKVNPITDSAQAAAFRLAGQGGYNVGIAYPATVALTSVEEPLGASLSMVPLLSGSSASIQSSSANLVGRPAVITLSLTGEYFLWIGGQIDDLTELSTGDYSGTFTITVDYDL